MQWKWILAIMLAQPMLAQQWTQQSPAASPVGRAYHALAAAGSQTVLFGGLGADGSLLSDTWLWNGLTWAPAPASTPPARMLHAMAAAGNNVLLFGGSNSSVAFNDTWLWNGTNWIQQNPTTAPSARAGHAMAHDVLFGGQSASGVSGETWAWDGTNWIQKNPAATPPARSLHAMAYDAARQRVVLFGGADSSSTFGDTWEWDGTTWAQKFPLNPPPARIRHAMAYDAAAGQVVMFGGEGAPPYGVLGDTWRWDGANWSQPILTTAPPAREQHSMACDAVRGQVVLFGGWGPAGVFNDTWVWGPGPAAQIRVIAATHTAGAGGQPAVAKAALELQLKVYKATDFFSLDPKNYNTVFESAIPPVAASITGPGGITRGGGPAYLYTIQAPANDSYLILGRGTVNGTTVYLGGATGFLAAGATVDKYLHVMVNGAGKIAPGKVTAVPGSLLVITEPEYLEFTSDTELALVVYESVEGAWSAVVTAEPPEGFVSNPGAIQLSVTDSTQSAAQFSIRDVGSSWTKTRLTHRIQHKGKAITIVSSPNMINNKHK